MKKLLLAFTTLALVGSVADAGKITCRRANGQIAKASECPPKKAGATAPGGPDVATAANTKKDKTGRCHWTTTAGKHKAGQLVKCP